MSWVKEENFTMTEKLDSAEQEFEATRSVYKALEPLDDEARERVFKHVAGMLEINATPKQADTKTDNASADAAEVPPPSDTPTFATFAELFDAADPQTAADKALVAGYWLQVIQKADSFDGQSANKELNHLGHKLANVTNALTALNAQRPSLAIQLAKSGSSQQARKKYKITVAGIEAVKAMLNG
jgi:hypothetical protein